MWTHRHLGYTNMLMSFNVTDTSCWHNHLWCLSSINPQKSWKRGCRASWESSCFEVLLGMKVIRWYLSKHPWKHCTALGINVAQVSGDECQWDQRALASLKCLLETFLKFGLNSSGDENYCLIDVLLSKISVIIIDYWGFLIKGVMTFSRRDSFIIQLAFVFCKTQHSWKTFHNKSSPKKGRYNGRLFDAKHQELHRTDAITYDPSTKNMIKMKTDAMKTCSV